jgi:AraC-like DNA-binding protein
METQPYQRASIVQGFLFAGARVGLDPSDAAKRSGIELNELEDVDAVVPYEKQLKITRLVMTHQSRTNSSLNSVKHFVPKRYGLVGHLMHHAPTLGQAMADFSRYQNLTGNIHQTQIAHVPDGIRMNVDLHPLVRKHQDYLAVPSRPEAPLTVLLALARHLTGKRIKPLRVSFRHQPTGDPDEHEDYFGVRAQFGMRTDEIIFTQDTLDSPLLETDGLKYRRALDLVLAHIDPIADLRVVGATLRQRLLQSMHLTVPKISVVARSMGMSTRTLQRRLKGEGTTFDHVVEQVRKDLTLQHIINPTISTYEIAGMVGFVEASPFFRAFRRWFGCTPKEWRRKHRLT